jgi:hypothetical protein
VSVPEQRTQSARRTEPGGDRRKLARWMFHLHLWFGIVTTAMLLIVAVTGVLLNHKRGLGLMPDLPHEPSGTFEQALPLARLANAASEYVGPQIAAAGIDRMDVRPGDGIVKVRFKDDIVTEIDVDLNNARIVGSDARSDVFLEKLHSGEIFGKRWVLLSDVAAAGLVIALITGVWLWLFPKSRL